MRDSGPTTSLKVPESERRTEPMLPFQRSDMRSNGATNGNPAARRSHDDDGWPWNHDAGDDLIALSLADCRSVASGDANGRCTAAAGKRWDDHSATEDVVLSRQSIATESNDRKPVSAGIAAQMPTARLGNKLRSGPSTAAPRRIGSGTLVPARLTWKPGDPFGDGRPTKRSKFRWELMLRSACITAACGLVAVWLLHSLLV